MSMSVNRISYAHLMVLIVLLAIPSMIQNSSSQLSSISNPPNANQQFVTYQKQSNFIHEFNVSVVSERGLKGITTDSKGNPWLYYQTNKTSTIMKFNQANNTFTQFPVEGNTITDNPVINLAGGQMIFDEKRNSIWFTDARINALGNIDIENGKTAIYRIPTNNSGVMGLVLSPDGNSIWFGEIIGNKIGSFDIASKAVTEFPTGDFTGPTLLTFDDKGQLWVTLSYSNSILKVEPWLLIPGTRASGMSEIKLEKPDVFSPFGIAIVRNNDNTSRLFVSDHGSSRVIVSNVSSELKSYISYWTSPSQAYPASLPSQVTSDKFGNIYFPQHGGNKISKISADTGLMTEFDIPTGPLATVVYIAVSPDASKVWFTEWASSKISYFDNKLQIPFGLKSQSNISQIILKINQTYPLEIQVSKEEDTSRTSSLLLLDQVEISAVGMTDSGLRGLTYIAKPPRVNISEISNINGVIDLNVNPNDVIAGKYTIMTRLSTLEKDNLTVSLLNPQLVKLDVPILKAQLQDLPTSQINNESSNPLIVLKDLARYASVSVAAILIGYLLYRRIANPKQIKGKKV
jgi:virginiamycin B lyase